MEPIDHRFVCPSCGQGRVSDRIIEPTPLVCGSHSDAVVSRIRQVTLPETGDNIVVRQESDIGTRSNVAFQGILQSDLLGSQERRRVSPSIRLEIPKSTCLQREIQDDHSQGCVQCIAQRGLGSKHRSQRCLLPCAHTQEVQTPATVRRSRKRRAPSFRIPSSTVRSNFGAKGVYKGNIALRSSCAHACCGSSTVSGRLAAEEPKQDTIGSANKLVGRHHSPGGIPTQRREISTSTHSAIDTHRCRISSRFRSDVSTDGPSSSVRRTDFRPIEPPSIDSLLLAVPPRTTELSNRLGRLHLRPLQLYMLAHWAPASKNLKALIPVKHDLLDHHLRWWLDRKCTRAGMLLDIPDAQANLFTDASESGWGAHLDALQVSGQWSTRETLLHINHLEMLAVRNALLAFKEQLTGMTVQLMSDNASVVSYLRKQGGTVSVPLYLLAREVLLLARDAQITLRAKHIPGERNALADLLSRMNKVVHTEWTLHQSVVDSLFITWDKPNVDLFATRMNNRLPVFVSPMADPLALDVDAMSISWKGMYAYAFPPFVMLGRVLEKVPRDHPCEMILIAPKWPNQSWYAKLMELLVAFPLALPQREDLLTQPHNHCRHQSLQVVCLHAWRLSSDPSKREVFLRQLPSRSPEVDVSLPELSMTANGGSSLVGVLRNRSIHSRSLFLN